MPGRIESNPQRLIPPLLLIGFCGGLLFAWQWVGRDPAPASQLAEAPAVTSAKVPVSVLAPELHSGEPTILQKNLSIPASETHAEYHASSSEEQGNADDFRSEIERVIAPVFANEFRWSDATRSALTFFIERLPSNLDAEQWQALRLQLNEVLDEDVAHHVLAVVERLYELRELESQQFDAQTVPLSMTQSIAQEEQRIELRRRVLGESLYKELYASDTPQGSSQESGISVDIDYLRQAGESDAMISAYLSEYDSPRTAAHYQQLRDVELWWERKYEAFFEERLVIDEAALDQAEKQRQIDALFRQHFTAAELTAAKAYDRLRQATDLSAPTPE